MPVTPLQSPPIADKLKGLPKDAKILVIRGADCKTLRHATDQAHSIDYFPEDGRPPRGDLRDGFETVTSLADGVLDGSMIVVVLEPSGPFLVSASEGATRA